MVCFEVTEKAKGMDDMKRLKTCLPALVVVGVLALFSFSDIFAQAPAPGTAAPAARLLRITDMTKLGKDALQRAPSLGNRGPKGRNWGTFDVEFETYPQWIDDMSITFTVMVDNPRAVENEKRFSLFTVTSLYRDIAMGRDHKAGVVLLPTALERYGNMIGFSVQIYVSGELAGEAGVGDGLLRTQDKWWSNPQITGAPNVQKLDGYLLERSKSVFALVDPDSYEVSR